MIFFNIERPFLVKIYFDSNDCEFINDSQSLPVFHTPPSDVLTHSFGLYVSSEENIKNAIKAFRNAATNLRDTSILQYFLYISGDVCRQTDLLKVASASGYPLIVEKGSFLAPDDIKRMVEKLGTADFALVECGGSFGYANRILDTRSLYELKKFSPCFGICMSDLLKPSEENYPYRPDWLSDEKFLDAFGLATEHFKPSFYVYKSASVQMLDKPKINFDTKQSWDGKITDNVHMNREKLTIIAGPCMFETLELGLQVGEYLKSLSKKYNFQYIFKSSFDKANRTSAGGIRGPGLEQGIVWFKQIKKTLNVPVLTDVHSAEQV